MEKYKFETDNYNTFRLVMGYLEGLKKKGDSKHTAQSSKWDEIEVFDELSYASWFLFDIISAIGRKDDDFCVLSHEELLNYENNGKKPFKAASLVARIGGATKVAKRLKKKEIFIIQSYKNEKSYKVRLSDVDIFWEKIENYEGEYEDWLEHEGFESPTLSSKTVD